jgi:hypothetical protein
VRSPIISPSPAAETTESDHHHDFNGKFFNTIGAMQALAIWSVHRIQP